jgi:hypothetical protein
MIESLNKFYQLIASDSLLSKQFELIVNKKDFSKLLVRLGAARGYNFSIPEIETTIKENTASDQGDYFCLPIGCWHKA